MRGDDLLLPHEAGREFDPPVSAARVRQLIDAGRLRGLRTAGGFRLITRDEVERFLAERRRQAEERAAND
jgi:excisionase family DNA binding protein